MKLFSARVVGGAVRNSLLYYFSDRNDCILQQKVSCLDDSLKKGLFTLDELDLATPYTPEQMIELAILFKLKSIPTGVEHGTVTILGRTYHEEYLKYIDILLKNSDSGIFDKWDAQSVSDACSFLLSHTKIENSPFCDVDVYEFTTLRIDVETDGRHAKVDFTTDWQADAMRRDFTMNALYVDCECNVYDYFSGIDDIKKRFVQFVGDPEIRIQEDYLRIVRFFRFNAYYGIAPWSEPCLSACKKHINGLKQISAERLFKEIYKIAKASDPFIIFKLMHECKVFEVIQWPIPIFLEDMHFASRLVELREFSDNILKHRITELGILSLFSGDWIVSKMSKIQYKYITTLQTEKIEKTSDWYRAIYEKGLEWVLDKLCVMLLKGQISAHSEQVSFLNKYRVNVQFPLVGQDVMDFGILPGKQVGDILNMLKTWWFEEEMMPDRDKCLKKLESIVR